FFAAIGLIVAYLFLLKITGFIITTPLFMIAFMLLLGEKSKGWILGVSVVMTGIIVVLFTKAMYVPLPRGVWLFREFSLLFF
ncbi:MAG: tripartite tricarboxylate transporter TctB family protein, partial [Proteobacteria bacterium]|nr:tripartite tricarboxylate transporter TctB family protein [Pseudomonadota bacterium]